MNVGIQPFTISAIDEPLPAKLDRFARAGYEGVELGADANTDAVHEKLVEHDLSVTSISSGLDQLDSDFDAHVAAAEDFGVDDVVVMWIGPQEFETRESVEANGERLAEWADRLADHGLQLHYHNHDHEFTEFGDETAHDVLRNATDELMFEVDVGWAGTGGVDPAALLDDLGDRVSLVHCKDMDFERGDFVTFGEGDLDVESVVSAADRNDVDWLVFENDDPEDPVAEPGHASVTLDRYTGHYC